MKRLILILLVVILTSCQLFLSPDPDSSPIGIFNAIWNDFNESYPLFNHKGIDWDEQYRIFSLQIRQQVMNDSELFEVISNMLSVLNDRHVSLNTPSRSYVSGCHDFGEGDSFSVNVLREHYLKNSKLSSGGISYGTFKDNGSIGYIHIRSFAGSTTGLKVDDLAMEIGGIVNSLKHTDALILDIRNNYGGSPKSLEYIASYFLSKKVNAGRSRTKNGPGRNDFSDWTTWAISPSGGSYALPIAKPIALLTNRHSVSASEWFSGALRTQDHVTHIGRPTGGGISTKIFRYLINGWSYSISIQDVTDMDGNRYEAKGPGEYGGIYPDFYIENHSHDLWSEPSTDSQIEFAIDYLLKKLAN